MQIAQDTVAMFHYRLTNADGQLLDSSEGDQPLAYLHGKGTLIPWISHPALFPIPG